MKQRIEDGYKTFFEPAEAMSTMVRAAVQIEPDPVQANAWYRHTRIAQLGGPTGPITRLTAACAQRTSPAPRCRRLALAQRDVFHPGNANASTRKSTSRRVLIGRCLRVGYTAWMPSVIAR